MSSVQSLREFISERLTAAAQEIFTEFEKTIVQYEQEIDRQRRLLDITWKPHTHLHTTDLPQHHTWKEEEVLTDQWLCNQERNSSSDQEEPGLPQIKEEHEDLEPPQIKEEQKDPEPPQIKEEHEDLEPPQGKPKTLEIKEEQETETFMETPVYKERNHRELQPNRDQQLSLNSSVSESQVQEVRRKTSGLSRDEELKQHKRSSQTRGHGDIVDHPKAKSNPKKCFVCLTCGKQFCAKNYLNVHMRTHTGERPFTCQICGKSYCEYNGFKYHMKTHTAERPFSCQICGKSYCGYNGFKYHMKTHTGERPFSCETCGKRFVSKYLLNIHMLSHTGEKPFSCQTCRKSFVRKDALKTHMKFHTGEKPFSCLICGKRYVLKSFLNRHMKTHRDYKV